MKYIVDKKKPIIGYYGALTTEWFDFELIHSLVEKHPELEFVLIGYIYPTFSEKETIKWIKKLEQYPNFSYLSAIDYSEIPNYAHWWSVAIIPFKINEITKVSKPGRRVYSSADDIPTIKSGRGMVIVSTSKGLMTGREAKKNRLGGEILVKVW